MKIIRFLRLVFLPVPVGWGVGVLVVIMGQGMELGRQPAIWMVGGRGRREKF